MLDYLVLYSSETGNTKSVANAIFNALPGIQKELCNIKDFHFDKEARLYFVGFRTICGSCDINIISFLCGLQEKKIALFGTCGFGKNSEYYHRITNNVSAFISDDCEYLGGFLCQGKMLPEIKKRYEAMLPTACENQEKIQSFLSNYEDALSHPNEQDFMNAQAFAQQIVSLCLTT